MVGKKTLTCLLRGRNKFSLQVTKASYRNKNKENKNKRRQNLYVQGKTQTAEPTDQQTRGEMQTQKKICKIWHMRIFCREISLILFIPYSCWKAITIILLPYATWFVLNCWKIQKLLVSWATRPRVFYKCASIIFIGRKCGATYSSLLLLNEQNHSQHMSQHVAIFCTFMFLH